MKVYITILFCLIGIIGHTRLFAQNIRIIPQPEELISGQGSFTLASEVAILAYPESKTTALILEKYLTESLGLQVKISASTKKKHKGQAVHFKLNEKLSKEAYELNIDKKGVTISASNNTGWFYGVQSLKQLLPVSSDSLKNTVFELPYLTIKDKPRFSWRAFMLDESRHFRGSKQVKLLLDEMAYLKMNVFHWHLVDDQGWRIEIKKYPLLTEIGSKRKSTQVDIGGGIRIWHSPLQTGEPHEGFYTQEEIKEIVKYATERHITVVPEIEMPGHSSAAIASYAWLGASKREIEVPTRFGGKKDVYDVSDPKVYQFLTDVLDETMALFPSNVIHIGGDEVMYNHWKASESIQAYMKEHNLKTSAELHVFFTNNISQYLHSKGRRMMGWNEILGHNIHKYQKESKKEKTVSNQKLASDVIVHFWRGNIEMASQAVSNGYDIVNSKSSETYINRDYDRLPLSKSYAFNPIPSALAPEHHNKVIGLGCQMWGEWTATDGEMHFHVFPRIAAYAEVGWTQEENKHFDNFKLALKHLQVRWKQKGIYYAPDEYVEGIKEK